MGKYKKGDKVKIKGLPDIIGKVSYCSEIWSGGGIQFQYAVKYNNVHGLFPENQLRKAV